MVEAQSYSYRNIYLRREDLNCFIDGNQLNDICISFYYEFLFNKEKYSTIKQDVLLLDPAVVINIYFDDCIEDLFYMLSPLDMKSKKYIFLPINDSNDRFQIGGGMHWALMVYSVQEDKYFYIDSTSSTIKHIHTISQKLKKIVNFAESNKNTEEKTIDEKNKGSSHMSSTIELSTVLTGIQRNSYDCGMYALCFTEVLLDRLVESKGRLSTKEEELKEVVLNVSQKGMSLKRKAIYDTILGFKV
mmetsp:Transcript_29668/g.30802  ORF Transcript_29668/g.30802 Transcript_29668/m.30802 type:complete len:245 (+) Transcript_29668:20-754(+)